jgi:nicotinamidase-related amidase
LPKAQIDRPAHGGAALLIIDMINDLDFEDAESLRAPAEAAAARIARLRDEADRLAVPAVYINDHFGQWHSERSKLVEHCLDSPGRDLTRRLAPRDDDYFVIKPQFSGFYSTNLPVLLPKLRATRLILTGVAADICVLFTAADAHMREYDLWVPADAVASSDDQRRRWALGIMQHSMGAEIRPTSELSLTDWVETGR